MRRTARLLDLRVFLGEHHKSRGVEETLEGADDEAQHKIKVSGQLLVLAV